jgi:D-alanyl-D-alanine carboxypeptidase (penicillin-binding protein 5/6)
MDADSGRVLFEKDGKTHRSNASTTKILTLILTLERGNLSDTVTVSALAARQPDVQLNINTGEEYRLEDLCYSMMLESHNDSAVAIAEHIGGSLEGFALLMNEKAEEIGCENSYFITPNGLDAEDETGSHGTSAIDLARILSYCVLRSPKAEQFLAITRTASYSFSDLSGKRSFTCSNHNSFLQMMDGALTGKTGYTSQAGYCYVGALERDGRTFVAALLGCGWPNNKTYKWSDCRKLFTYGLENYEYQTFYEPMERFTIPVENGADSSGNPYAVPLANLEEENHEAIRVLLRTDEKIVKEEKLAFSPVAPVERGSVGGAVNYYLEESDGTRSLLDRAKLYVQNDIPVKNLAFYISYVTERLIL